MFLAPYTLFDIVEKNGEAQFEISLSSFEIGSNRSCASMEFGMRIADTNVDISSKFFSYKIPRLFQFLHLYQI